MGSTSGGKAVTAVSDFKRLLWRDHPDLAVTSAAPGPGGAVDIAESVQRHAAVGICSVLIVEVMQVGVDPVVTRPCQLEHAAIAVAATLLARPIQIPGGIHRQRGHWSDRVRECGKSGQDAICPGSSG